MGRILWSLGHYTVLIDYPWHFVIVIDNDSLTGNSNLLKLKGDPSEWLIWKLQLHFPATYLPSSFLERSTEIDFDKLVFIRHRDWHKSALWRSQQHSTSISVLLILPISEFKNICLSERQWGKISLLLNVMLIFY